MVDAYNPDFSEADADPYYSWRDFVPGFGFDRARQAAQQRLVDVRAAQERFRRGVGTPRDQALLITSLPDRLAAGVIPAIKAMPAALWSGATLPGDVTTGKYNPTPVMEGEDPNAKIYEQSMHEAELPQRAMDTAGLATIGGGLSHSLSSGLTLGEKALYSSPKEATGVGIAAMAKTKPLYNQAERTVDESGLKAATDEQWHATLRNKGVKPDELANIEEWLAQHVQRKIPQQEIKAKVQETTPQINEVWKTNDIKDSLRKQGWSEDDLSELTPSELEEYRADSGAPTNTKFHQHQVPGGENYRELLMTLPGDKSALEKKIREQFPSWNDREVAAYLKTMAAPPGENYLSSHWDEPNVLAHVRMNDRTLPAPDGTPQHTLFLEELQSDWHQTGRKQGYKGQSSEEIKKLEDQIDQRLADPALNDVERTQLRQRYNLLQANETNAVPDAPFKGSKNWGALLLKRMVREAAEKGYDQIAWTDGATQAERYDLSKHVDQLTWNPKTGNLQGFKGDPPRSILEEQGVTAEKLPAYIGKEAADKMINSPTSKYSWGTHVLEGDGLKVGGEGMRGFYDQMLPRMANKLFGRWGAKVRQEELKSDSTKLLETQRRRYEELSQISEERDLTDAEFEELSRLESDGGTSNFDVDGEGELVGSTRSNKIHVLPITPELRQQAMNHGFSLYAGGKKATAAGAVALAHYPVEKMRDYTATEFPWEWREYDKYARHNYPDLFKDQADFKAKYDEAPLVHLPEDTIKKMDYATAGQYFNVGKERGLSAFKGHRDVNRIQSHIDEGKVAPPIVLLTDKGYRILGGNTRMAIGAAQGLNIPVKLIDVRKKLALPPPRKDYKSKDFMEPYERFLLKYPEHHNNLSATDVKAIRYYTNGHYKPIANHLYEGEPLHETYAKTLHDLDEALGKSRLPTNLVVWRGVSQRTMDKIDRLKPGQIWTNTEGYLSTSLSRSFAKRWKADYFKVVMPRDSKGLVVGPLTSASATENELLLPRNQPLFYQGRDAYGIANFTPAGEAVPKPIEATVKPAPAIKPTKTKYTQTQVDEASDFLTEDGYDLEELESLTPDQMVGRAIDNGWVPEGSLVHEPGSAAAYMKDQGWSDSQISSWADAGDLESEASADGWKPAEIKAGPGWDSWDENSYKKYNYSPDMSLWDPNGKIKTGEEGFPEANYWYGKNESGEPYTFVETNEDGDLMIGKGHVPPTEIQKFFDPSAGPQSEVPGDLSSAEVFLEKREYTVEPGADVIKLAKDAGWKPKPSTNVKTNIESALTGAGYKPVTGKVAGQQHWYKDEGTDGNSIFLGDDGKWSVIKAGDHAGDGWGLQALKPHLKSSIEKSPSKPYIAGNEGGPSMTKEVEVKGPLATYTHEQLSDLIDWIMHKEEDVQLDDFDSIEALDGLIAETGWSPKKKKVKGNLGYKPGDSFDAAKTKVIEDLLKEQEAKK